ncbi:Proline/sodium symporter PutP (TC 2.A.21.2.1) @ Propionate/sodium symporter [Micrococcus lylae]|uniref:Sodium/proline symporter n=1 Tax=Micrococcus lylae TaxID=1273 RepID=A0A1R4IFK8_9MICC|nr:sodium/proline symporter PutP [Micrococcus lylae]SJN18607.1 Proline/sodium symporter PutP (TC 2.A.21.2.1) @ Propionate/sodium symporter [Micrococcus lylae]
MDLNTVFLIAAILLYFTAMIFIGLYAARQNTDLDDYMLAGRNMKPSVAALSAGASDMSGWLLMGLPGAIYASGLVEGWMAIGLTVGAWVNWKVVAPRLRSYTEVSGDSITIPSFLENRFKDRTHILRIVSGLIILVFFTFYVSSGMVAGGKFVESTFGPNSFYAEGLEINYLTGMLVVAGITVLYTLFGGFLGASLTDVAQGLLMFVSLLLVPIFVIVDMGGWNAVVEGIRAVDAQPNAEGVMVDHLSLFKNATLIGVLSSVAWGLGYFGQPHIIVRFMALRTPQDATTGRRVGVSWMALSVFGAVMVALVGIAYFQANPGTTLDDTETVFLVLAAILFHPFVAGLVLAAVLAAIMSTISSQLIVCSSALVEDLYKVAGKDPSPNAGLWLGRIGVLIVAVIAGILALNPEASVLELVSFAWAGFGAAFGPVILLALYWEKFTSWGAMAAVVSGAAVAWFWSEADEKTWEWFGLYEIVPGFLTALILGVVVSLFTQRSRQVNKEINREFTGAIDIVAGNEVTAADPKAATAEGGSTAAPTV